jgi:hypothetical protein
MTTLPKYMKCSCFDSSSKEEYVSNNLITGTLFDDDDNFIIIAASINQQLQDSIHLMITTTRPKYQACG